MPTKLEQIPKYEDMHTEFVPGRLDPIISMSDVCAFLNTEGGKIYFGVNKDGRVVGVDKSNRVIEKLELLFKKYFGDFLDCFKVSKKSIEKKTVVIATITKRPEGHGFVSYDDHYFFRSDNKTFGTIKDRIDYALKVLNYKLPIFANYYPIDAGLHPGEYTEIYREDIRLQSIGDIPKGPYLYKYMDLESALLCLDNRNLRFVEPTQWDDQYEGRFYNAKYYNDNEKRQLISPEKTPLLYACCFTTKRENEAAWTLYSHNRSGLASRCVEFRLNRRELFDTLSNYAFANIDLDQGKYPSIFFGNVIYENKSDIDYLHNRNSIHYHKYFDSFSLECYLDLLLLKRNAFEHEKEMRIFIVPTNQKNKEKTRRTRNGEFYKGKTPQCLYVPICWEHLVEEVRIDKNCSKYEKSILQSKLDLLYHKQKEHLIKKGTSFDDDKLKSKFQLVEFDPYEDKSLNKGPISIKAN